jgi:hypothetical protein
LRRWALASSFVLGAAASATTVRLQSGDSVTFGGMTVTCNVAPAPPECQTCYGNAYGGQCCDTFHGEEYCDG